MDGIDVLMKLKLGYKPENKKEEWFVSKLKDEGFVYFNKLSNNFKLNSEAIVEEEIEEVKLYMTPKIQYLGLFLEQNNFTPSLERKMSNLHIQLNYLANMQTVNWSRVLTDKKLGEEILVDIIGFGKNETNEAYSIDLPMDIRKMYYGKGVPHFTVALSKSGKEKDSANLNFKPIRRSQIKAKLGVGTNFGVFFSFEELSSAKRTIIFNKAEFYA